MNAFKSVDYLAIAELLLKKPMDTDLILKSQDVKKLVVPLLVPFVFCVLSIVYCIVLQCVCMCCGSQARASKLKARMQSAGGDAQEIASQYAVAQRKANRCSLLNLIFYFSYFVAPVLAVVAISMMGAGLANLLKTDYVNDITKVPAVVLHALDPLLADTGKLLSGLQIRPFTGKETLLKDMVFEPSDDFAKNVNALCVGIPEAGFFTQLQTSLLNASQTLGKGLSECFGYQCEDSAYTEGAKTLKADGKALSDLTKYINDSSLVLYKMLLKALFVSDFSWLSVIKQLPGMLGKGSFNLAGILKPADGNGSYDYLFDGINSDANLTTALRAIIAQPIVLQVLDVVDNLSIGKYDIVTQLTKNPNYIQQKLSKFAESAKFDIPPDTVDLFKGILTMLADLPQLKMRDIYKMFDEDKYFPEVLKPALNFGGGELGLKWLELKHNYTEYINKLKGQNNFFSKFNSQLSGYRLRYITNVVYLIAFAFCTLALFSLLLKCVPMLKRDPGKARYAICCAPCGQLCMSITLLFFGIFALLTTVFTIIIQQMGDLGPIADFALTQFPQYTENMPQQVQQMLPALNAPLQRFGLNLDVSMDFASSQDLIEKTQISLDFDLDQVEMIQKYSDFLDSGLLAEALCWQLYNETYVAALVENGVASLPSDQFSCTEQFEGKTAEEIADGVGKPVLQAQTQGILDSLDSVGGIFAALDSFGLSTNKIMDAILSAVAIVDAIPRQFSFKMGLSPDLLQMFSKDIAFFNLFTFQGKTLGEYTGGWHDGIAAFLDSMDEELAELTAKINFVPPSLLLKVSDMLRDQLVPVLTQPPLNEFAYKSDSAPTDWADFIVQSVNNASSGSVDTSGFTFSLAADQIHNIVLFLIGELKGMKNSSYFGCSTKLQYNNDSNDFKISLDCAKNYTTLMYAGMSHRNFINLSDQSKIQHAYQTHEDFTNERESLNNAFICNEYGQCQPNFGFFTSEQVKKRFDLFNVLVLCENALNNDSNLTSNSSAYESALKECTDILNTAGDKLYDIYKDVLEMIFNLLKDSKIKLTKPENLVDFARAIAGVVERTCAPAADCEAEVEGEPNPVPVPSAGDLEQFANRFAGGFLAYDIYIQGLIEKIMSILKTTVPAAIGDSQIGPEVGKVALPLVDLAQNTFFGDTILSTRLLGWMRTGIEYPFKKLQKTSSLTYEAYFVAWAALVLGPIMAAAAWPFLRRSADWRGPGKKGCCGRRGGAGRAKQGPSASMCAGDDEGPNDGESSQQMRENASTLVLSGVD